MTSCCVFAHELRIYVALPCRVCNIPFPALLHPSSLHCVLVKDTTRLFCALDILLRPQRPSTFCLDPISFTWRHRHYDCPLGSFKTSVDESWCCGFRGRAKEWRRVNSPVNGGERGIISSTGRFISLITFVEHDNGQRNLALKWNWGGRQHPPLKLPGKGPCISPAVISRTTARDCWSTGVQRKLRSVPGHQNERVVSYNVQ